MKVVVYSVSESYGTIDTAWKGLPAVGLAVLLLSCILLVRQ